MKRRGKRKGKSKNFAKMCVDNFVFSFELKNKIFQKMRPCLVDNIMKLSVRTHFKKRMYYEVVVQKYRMKKTSKGSFTSDVRSKGIEGMKIETLMTHRKSLVRGPRDVVWKCRQRFRVSIQNKITIFYGIGCIHSYITIH